MRLLPNVYKYNSLNDNVEAYHPMYFGKERQNDTTQVQSQVQRIEWLYTSLKDFALEEQEEENLASEKEKHLKEISLDEESEEELEEEASLAEEILRQAKEEAEKILKDAKEEAERIVEAANLDAKNRLEEATLEGLQQGRFEGEEKAYREHREKLDTECNRFLKEFQRVITETELKKLEIFQQHRTDLKDLAISIAEKVIQVSLRSSGDVIEKMIVAATEKLKSKLWAKIYIAKCDANLMVQGNSDLMKHISHISDHIKIIIMENENPGTCIIEFPDEVIDASASTQVENIKEILNSAGM